MRWTSRRVLSSRYFMLCLAVMLAIANQAFAETATEPFSCEKGQKIVAYNVHLKEGKTCFTIQCQDAKGEKLSASDKCVSGTVKDVANDFVINGNILTVKYTKN